MMDITVILAQTQQLMLLNSVLLDFIVITPLIPTTILNDVQTITSD